MLSNERTAANLWKPLSLFYYQCPTIINFSLYFQLIEEIQRVGDTWYQLALK